MPRGYRDCRCELLLLTALLALFVSSSIVSANAQPAPEAKTAAPCPAANVPANWKTYANRKHGFCFSYPPGYEPIAEPWADKYTHNPIYSEQLRSAARDERELRLVDDTVSQGSENPQAPHPYINVYLRAEPFKLNNFVDRSWVDCCGEPGQKNIGGHAFYYSGARGGGVAYPDAFFFDLNGHVLEFVFDGPYRDGSTPTPETKKIEQTMLESFKSF